MKVASFQTLVFLYYIIHLSTKSFVHLRLIYCNSPRFRQRLESREEQKLSQIGLPSSGGAAARRIFATNCASSESSSRPKTLRLCLVPFIKGFYSSNSSPSFFVVNVVIVKEFVAVSSWQMHFRSGLIFHI